MKQLSILFHGTRGSSTPLRASTEFGIHTTCVEIIPGQGTSFFIDLGTGITGAAGNALLRGLREFDIFLTHFHSDHISGIFSLAPLYSRACVVNLRAAGSDITHVVPQLLSHPLHPVTFHQLPATVNLQALPRQGSLNLPERGLEIAWAPIPHPQGATAFRVDDGQNAILFATDIELARQTELAGLRHLATHPYPAGLAVIDGFFTPEQLPEFAGWGHSSYREAIQFSQQNNIRHTIITHHHPERTDQELAAFEHSCTEAQWAREETTCTLSSNILTPKLAI